MQNLTADGKVIQINRPCDKRKVLFYYDHSTDFEVDEEFIKQVRFTPYCCLLICQDFADSKRQNSRFFLLKLSPDFPDLWKLADLSQYESRIFPMTKYLFPTDEQIYSLDHFCRDGI